ncbi:hypothetical protein BKA83DRAFT_677790 [Pisolithus microcarpus]|nr:hypothetical protein BKA83DRAFT_677790 [Pisolithus microcarpus]
MALQLVVTRFLLPAVIFLGLAAIAVHFLFLNGVIQKTWNPFVSLPFEVSSSPLRLPYTGYEEVDKTSSVLPRIAFLFAEAARDQRPFFMAMPAVFGVLMQTMSFGLIMPLYSLLFVIAGTGVRSGSGSRFKINQANAEALLFAVLVGYIVPTVCMVLFEDAIVTAIWQIFPNYHGRLFLPYVGSDDPAAYPLIDNIAGFFKWDFTLGVLFLWFADDLLQCTCHRGLGPGAAISSVLMWREEKLNRFDRTAKEKAQ